MMEQKDFDWMIVELNKLVRTTSIKVALINEETKDMFEALDEAVTPIGVNGFDVMVYEHLSDDHVLFFAGTEDAKEFIEACEEFMKDSKDVDPKAAVGVIVELSKQRIQSKERHRRFASAKGINSITEQENNHDGINNPERSN